MMKKNLLCFTWTLRTVLSGSRAMSGTLASTIKPNRFRIKFACLRRYRKAVQHSLKKFDYIIFSQLNITPKKYFLLAFKIGTGYSSTFLTLSIYFFQTRTKGILPSKLLVILCVISTKSFDHFFTQLHWRWQWLRITSQNVSKVNMKQFTVSTIKHH